MSSVINATSNRSNLKGYTEVDSAVLKKEVQLLAKLQKIKSRLNDMESASMQNHNFIGSQIGLAKVNHTPVFATVKTEEYNSMPNVLKFLVLGFLPPRDCASYALVCRDWNRYADAHVIVKSHVRSLDPFLFRQLSTFSEHGKTVNFKLCRKVLYPRGFQLACKVESARQSQRDSSEKVQVLAICGIVFWTIAKAGMIIHGAPTLEGEELQKYLEYASIYP